MRWWKPYNTVTTSMTAGAMLGITANLITKTPISWQLLAWLGVCAASMFIAAGIAIWRRK